MKNIRWKWLLPIVLLILSAASIVYWPHEYRVKAQRDGAVDNIEYFLQNAPALVERISEGINFPALVLRFPLLKNANPIYEHNSDYTLIWISPREVGFFTGIALFWYYVGRKVDQHQGRIPRRTWPRSIRMAGLIGGLIFGILTGAYAALMIASRFRPDRQIGVFGIAWSVAIIAYFIWQLARVFRTGGSRPPTIQTSEE